MKSIICSVLLFFSFGISTKANIIVQGVVKGHYGKPTGKYHLPIDGFPNIMHNTRQLQFVNDSVFYINEPLTQPGFMNFVFPGAVFNVFVQPRDTLKLHLYYGFNSKNNQYIFDRIVFQGKNAEGHNQFSNSAWGNGKQQLFLNESLFANKYEKINNFFIEFTTLLEEILYPYEKLFFENKIDSLYYNIVINHIKGTYYYSALDLFGYYIRITNQKLPTSDNYKSINNAKEINSHLFTKENFKLIRISAYTQFDPFNKFLSFSLLGSGYANLYSKDIIEGNVLYPYNFDSTFTKLGEKHKYLGLLNEGLLEREWATLLYMNSSLGESDHKKIQDNFKLYKTHFPESSFISIIESRLADRFADMTFESSIKRDIQVIHDSTINSFELLADQMQNVKFIFVDIWATWCIPCIREFNYKNQLKEFLDKSKIAILYLSIDELLTIKQWNDYVHTKNLYGYHFLANEAIIKTLKSGIYEGNDITIPRYVLLNTNGQVLSKDLPRPSDFEKLKQEIIRLMR